MRWIQTKKKVKQIIISIKKKKKKQQIQLKLSFRLKWSGFPWTKVVWPMLWFVCCVCFVFWRNKCILNRIRSVKIDERAGIILWTWLWSINVIWICANQNWKVFFFFLHTTKHAFSEITTIEEKQKKKQFFCCCSIYIFVWM